MLRVLFVIGTSQYDSTMLFMKEMAEEMKAGGYDITVLDVNDRADYEKKRTSLKSEYDVIFTVNGMILEQDSTLGGELLQGEDTLYCTYLMDHPMIHLERLKSCYPRILVLSPDRDHVQFVDQYMKNIWCAGFLPHAGCAGSFVKKWKERSTDLSFFGSYVSPKVVWEHFADYPQAMCELMREVSQELIRQSHLTLESVLSESLKNRGIQAGREEFLEMMGEFWQVDRYVRCYFRDQVIRVLVESGITVDVYGDGWDQFETTGKEFLKVHTAVSFQEALEITGNSKISLNVMPWFKDGSHDRVFTAMLNGAICLTDGSEYLSEIGKEEENIYFYSLKGLKYLPAKVRRILSDTAHSEEVALAGKALAEEYHTWRSRAWEVLDYWEQLAGMEAGEQENSRTVEEFQELQALIRKNGELLRIIQQTVGYFRRQEYLYAMRRVTDIIDMLSQLLPEYAKWQEYFNQQEVLIDLSIMGGMMEEILKAGQGGDHIWLADLLELSLRPFIVSLQEYYGGRQVAPETGLSGYRLEYTSCGMYTLATEGEKSWMYLHTNGDVWREAEMLADSWFEKGIFRYVVYGLGLGYHIQALLDIDETVTVTVLEPDANMIALEREYGVSVAWGNRVEIRHDPKFAHLVKVADQLSSEERFVVHYPSMQRIESEFYRKQLEDYFIQYSSAKTQLTRLQGNFVRNRNGFDREVSELREHFAGKTLYIIAAGPSLDRNIQELKKIGDRGIVLATGTVLKKLLKEGIQPDYAIIIDGGRATHSQILEAERCQVPLLYMATVYHRIPAEYQGEKYVIFQKDFEYSESYAEEKGYPLFQSGGSVTTTALDIGIQFGCSRIVFVGLDLAYTDDKDHASDTALVRSVEQDGTILVEDIHGNMVRTVRNLNLYREWIEKRITGEEEIEFIDATEGGARIQGTKIRKLSEVIRSAELNK